MGARSHTSPTSPSGSGPASSSQMPTSMPPRGLPTVCSASSSGASKAAAGSDDWAEGVSRGYTEEMEHFCWAVREFANDGYYRDGVEIPRADGGLRCNGVVAMADAIMAHTANLAMHHKKRIEFKPEWFDPTSDAAPETDPEVVG